MRGEKFVIRGHQLRLTDRGARLLLGEVSRPRIKPKCAHARSDGARGDENDLASGFSLRSQLFDELFHLGQVRLFPGVRQNAGADLYDEARDIFEQFGTHAEKLRIRSSEAKRKCREDCVDSPLQKRQRKV